MEATPLAPISSVGVTSVNARATADAAKAAPAVNIRRQALDPVDKELIKDGC